jgi:probable rRNA maturation factor
VSIIFQHLDSNSSFNEDFTKWLTSVITDLLKEYNLTGGEVGVIIAGDKLLHNLNLQYRAKDTPTDVLSFSYLDDTVEQIDENEFAVGDIYVSRDRIKDQAEEAGHSLQREAALLVIHGTLHLLGLDHEHDEDAELMQQKERSLMEKYDLHFAEG